MFNIIYCLFQEVSSFITLCLSVFCDLDFVRAFIEFACNQGFGRETGVTNPWCNAKRFAIAILFFLFLIPSAVFGRTAKSLLAKVLRLVTLEACNQGLTLFLGHTKKYFCKNCS